MSKTTLREGFSTGSAATAAAMAALQYVLDCDNYPKYMDIPLPPQDNVLIAKSLRIPIVSVSLQGIGQGLGIVKKDGGDDPDVTHNAYIHAHIRLNNRQGQIHIKGGQGVGYFTLPGLPLPVGEAAINPAPRKQIRTGLLQVAQKYNYTGGIELCIIVPDGERLAKKTFNPRLGIMGGISILGTQGTVRPFSHKAWKATISQGLQVAFATGCDIICLSTGRRSERLLLKKYSHLSAQSAVQVADFAQFSLQEAAKYPFELVWGCFFGKLVKLAQGHAYTHAHSSTLDFALLAKWCQQAGLESDRVEEVKLCVTANHALEIILTSAYSMDILSLITKLCASTAENFAGRRVKIHLFHLDGRELFSL